MFVAQIILCSSIVGHCVGFEDSGIYNLDINACEKRVEALAQDAGQSMPHFVVARKNCKKIPGFAA